MDPSSPDCFRRLRLSLQIILIAICSGAGQALYCAALLASRDVIQQPLALSLLDFIKFLSVSRFLLKEIPLVEIFASFVIPAQMEGDFEMEFEQPMPKRLQYLIPTLRAAVILFMFRYPPISHEGWWVPLRLLWTEPPPWMLQLAYAAFGLKLIASLTPRLAVGFYGPSATVWVIRILVYPCEAWMAYVKRRLAGTFIAGPRRCTQPNASARRFEYEPITEPGVIRLLRLECVGLKISATLEHHPIGGCPPYWAVSYVWGQPIFNHALLFDTGNLPITSSCADVLHTLTPFRARRLWIDAVCINQADPDEKSRQIPLMAAIYSGAEQVVGCLGTGVMPNAPMPQARQPMSSTFLFDLIRYLRFTEPIIATAPQLLFSHQVSDWHDLAALLNHPYWARAWVVQELLLAKRLVFTYGDVSFSWKHYCYAVNSLYARWDLRQVANMDHILKYVPTFCASLTVQSERIGRLADLKPTLEKIETSQPLPLARVLDHHYRVEATDERDQVYALLNLAADGNAEALKPDYSSGVTYQQVITRTTLYTHSLGQLNLLLIAGLGYRPEEEDAQNQEPSLPSWIPVLPPALRWRTTNPLTRTARTNTYPVEFSASGNNTELNLLGTLADKVAAMCPVSVSTPLIGALQRAFNIERGTDETANPPNDPECYLEFMKSSVSQTSERLAEFCLAARQFAHGHIPELLTAGHSDEYWRAMAMDRDGVDGGEESSITWATKLLFHELETAFSKSDKEGHINFDGDLGKKPSPLWETSCFTGFNTTWL